MASLRDDIVGQFELFNIKPSEAEISKCLQICTRHNVSGEDMVDQWFAYSSSELGGAAPTVAHLESLERKKIVKKTGEDKRRALEAEELLLEELEESKNVALGSPDQFTGICPADLSATPKGKDVPTAQTNTPLRAKALDEPMDVTINTYTPCPASQSQAYSHRSDALSVCCSYGTSRTNFQSSKLDLTVKPLYEDVLSASQPIMFEILQNRAASINSLVEEFFAAVRCKYNLAVPGEVNQDDIFGNNVVLYGRILSEAGGRPTPETVRLEQTQAFKGQVVALNMSKMSKYSLYPGQVVAVKGTYVKGGPKGDKLVAEEIFADTDFKFAPEPPLTEGTLQMVIACGPFTCQDNLSFDPLKDLLQYVSKCKPNVLLLVGPFYETSHSGIYNNELLQTFDNHFVDIIDSIMKVVPAETHVIVVSSSREPHHFPVYPTLPYEIATQYDNLTFMPDPCLVKVNGVLIGTTSADVLFDLGRVELHVDKIGASRPDRMGRLISHLFKQQNFYPLDLLGEDFVIDYSLMEEHGIMTVKPHVMILPSNLKHLIKEIDGCLVINPERLTKGFGGGCFALLEISAGTTETICGRSSCQVLKI
ncbi:DNA polymerase alpha subunit B [Euwallacea fornicatus]|uniref:DNA polymerase alpha subunit B n=1 Tax=Euwallacea fornicatus TaxID=995702 RepID=UPI00338F22D6